MGWESSRNRQQGSVLVTGLAIKVPDTLSCSCSSTALAVEVSQVRAMTGYASMSIICKGGEASGEWKPAWLDMVRHQSRSRLGCNQGTVGSGISPGHSTPGP